MHASKSNICNILGTNTGGLKITRAPAENGWKIRGFLSRIALNDLNNNFHIYLKHTGELVVLTPGRLNRKDKKTN